MLLAIDVGNTNIVYGIFRGKELISSFRISTDTTNSSDEYGMLFLNTLKFNKIKKEKITDVIISSVVPSLMYTLESMVRRYFGIEPIIVTDKIKTGINIEYDNPSELGADRIVNAVACVKKYKGPYIILDIGTALTFCVIDEDKNYLGGLIYPGIGISADALFKRTSKLPSIEIVKPERVVGKSTTKSMQSALYYGYTSLIDGIILKIIEEMDFKDVTIIGTGGFASLLLKDTKYEVIIDRGLTLEGLRMLFEMNKDLSKNIEKETEE